MHPATTRIAVRRAFVVQRLPLSEAARAAGVNANTARAWKKAAAEGGDDWDRAREAIRLADGGFGSMTERVIGDFSRMFTETMARLQETDAEGESLVDPIEGSKSLATLADAYAKVMRAAGRADPGLSRLGIALDVIDRLTRFVQDRDADALDPLLPLLAEFGEDLAQELG